jgi:DNA-binding transcriptional MerR regulator
MFEKKLDMECTPWSIFGFEVISMKENLSYSIGEVAKKLRLTNDTLRYYEKEGLLPPIKRDLSGKRCFSDSDLEWVFLIRCLRDTDMPISKIKKYISLLMNSGENSVLERREILSEHRVFIKKKVSAYKYLLKLIEKKLEYYDEALSSEDPEAVRCMDYQAEWENFRAIQGGIKI